MAQAMLKPCSICKKPSTEKYRPFCSVRCANEDLGRWFTESYRVPTPEIDDTSESADQVQDEGEA